MWNGCSQAVEPRLAKSNGTHVSPKTASDALVNEDAGMDNDAWKVDGAEEVRESTAQRAAYKPSKEE